MYKEHAKQHIMKNYQENFQQQVAVVTIAIGELKHLIAQAVKEGIQEAIPPAPEKTEYITRNEAKTLLGCKSLATIDNHVKRGTLKKYYIGTLVRLRRDEILNLASK